MESLDNLMERGNKALLKAQETNDDFFYETSIEIFMDVINYYPNFSVGFRNLGSAFSGFGKYKNAVKAYTQSLKIKDNKPDEKKASILFDRGIANFQLNNNSQAIEDLEESLILDENYLTYNWIGAIKGEVKEYLEAFEYHEKSLELCKDKEIKSIIKKNIKNSWINFNFFLSKLGHESVDMEFNDLDIHLDRSYLN